MKEKFRRKNEMRQMELVLDVVNDFIIRKPGWFINSFKKHMDIKG